MKNRLNVDYKAKSNKTSKDDSILKLGNITKKLSVFRSIEVPEGKMRKRLSMFSGNNGAGQDVVDDLNKAVKAANEK